MRSFIAVDVDDALKARIRNVQSRISEGKIKFVEPENLHFTLKFLGEITDEKAGAVTAALKEICTSFNAFPIILKGVGVFPSLDYMKVI